MSALLALLLAAASPAEEAARGAIEAERAFAQMAQAEGQWTAFRAYAADQAVMFAPHPVYAHALLETLDDPPISVRWWPARSFVSCDGTLVVNTGPWVRPGPRFGYFVTVWRKQPDGRWLWLLDDGRDLEAPIPAGEQPVIRQASCAAQPSRLRTAAVAQAGPVTSGSSPDRTLSWAWHDHPARGSRLVIGLFDGEQMEQVLVHETPALIP